MGFYRGAQIVRDGLVLCLDAGSERSYPKSGTIWKDLSGNRNNASMFGSVPYETDVTQCFNFATATGTASANSSLGFTFTSNMIPTTGNFTLSVWVKNPNSFSGQVGLFSNAGSGNGYRFGIGLNGIYVLIGPTYTEGGINFITPISSNTWNNVVAVYSRTTAQILLYLNGIFQNFRSIPVSQTEFSNVPPGIVRSPCCGIYTGKLATFSAYNRTLTPQEIQQNYTATKSRFGL
jgi:hypothetical protein